MKSVAWTIVSLFDPSGEIQTGRWRCPLFNCPTKLGQDIGLIARETGYTGMDLLLRIAAPKDRSTFEEFKAT